MVKPKEDLTGKRFGKLIVIEQAADHVSKSGQHSAAWRCKCDCGNDNHIVTGSDLKKGGVTSCGCLRRRQSGDLVRTRQNLIGKRFGRLTVISRANDISESHDTKLAPAWNCLCDCGNTVVVRGYALIRGTSQSCGCLAKELKQQNYKKENEYDLESREYGVGYTSKGEEFWFDKEDYELIKPYYWRYGTGGYLLAYNPLDISKAIAFHRLVMGVVGESWMDIMVDHIVHEGMDVNKYDNRKSNLRLVNRCQNNQNAKLRKDNTSGVKGVTWNKRRAKWEASITCQNVTYWLGAFSDFNEAVQARKKAETELFKEYVYREDETKNEESIINRSI